MASLVAKVAVSAAKYWIDRPYDYRIPEDMAEKAVPGVRVYVPFAKGNRRCEGIILAVTDHSELQQLKSILALVDQEPILSADQLRLALFMRDRFFCTVYDAVKAMLPAGLWMDEDGKQRVKDRYIQMARLAIPVEEASAIAQNKRLRAPLQSHILELLCSFEALPSKDINRYVGAKGDSIKALAKAGFVELYMQESFRRPEVFAGEMTPLPVLNAEQQQAFEGLSRIADSGKAAAALLFGVTGSGKTSVYIHLIRQQLSRGKSAILLVPEIALTPQMLQTFSSHFGDEVAVLHSSLSPGERYDEWKRVRQGRAHLVIGTRSAVFAPVRDLGLVIIDEEQEETYKSESVPRYHAREVAKFLCAKADCLLLLGSATPDIVSRYYAETGRYSFFSLHGRYNEMELPEVRIVDMKRELRRGNGGNISSFLRQELQANIERGEQSILFINRRGANKLVSCGECGFTYRCPRCSVSLTYHSANRRLICHYCGYSRFADPVCPDCEGNLKFIGAGTQLVEEELHELFPDIQVLRMDTDTVAPAGSHEQLFARFRQENIPVMVGTQMVTKGLNFENVTLVGVISADQSLYAGDYRAGERTFSLITQVVGRSGRGSKPGRAVIQTYTPGNETIHQASNQDYEAFYRSELEMRRLQAAPPFRDILTITATGPVEANVVRACRVARQRLEQLLAGREETTVLGPAPLAVVRVNDRFRYRVILSCRADAAVRKAVAQTVIACNTDKSLKDVSLFADNDPMD